MFDLEYMTHDEAVKWLMSIRNLSSKEKVMDLFISSLSTRQLAWRSGLSAYSISRHFPNHKYDINSSWATYLCCDICGDFIFNNGGKRNLNHYNANRYRTGGWHGPTAPFPLAFYLSEINILENIKPTSIDIAILQAIHDCIFNCSEALSLMEVEKRLSKVGVFKSNLQERKSLLETLAFCGILETKQHKGYLSSFVPPVRAELKPDKNQSGQWSYPAIWWTGKDGINTDAWNYWFGAYKL
jgi:hypothetical protein